MRTPTYCGTGVNSHRLKNVHMSNLNSFSTLSVPCMCYVNLKPVPEFFLSQFLVKISKSDVGSVDLFSSVNVP